MKRAFINDDFLLGSGPARELYHQFAKHQPIIDFHNHLSAAQIAANHQFGDLHEIWLAGDHYKWRAMRANGVTEREITGDASSAEKFQAWARTVPWTLRNPLYHWTHLELARYFDIYAPLGPDTANTIWRESNALLPELRVHDILGRFDVRVLCTTDDPADSLAAHHQIRASKLSTQVCPTYRPDKALLVLDPKSFGAWLDKLGSEASMQIATFDDLLAALKKRHDDFHDAGCRASDHSLSQAYATPCSHADAQRIFSRACEGHAATPEEQGGFASRLMLEFGRWNAARGWVLQLHLGPLRNTNQRLLRGIGVDAGCDSIGDYPQGQALATFLDALDRTGELPRTILYNVNPTDNYLFAAMAGNFQDGTVPGKIQLGSGWWFLDQKEGMEWQLNALSNLGLLRRFVGMVTDSRSFLSFPRHEYFRRVLCNLLGSDMESGVLPAEIDLVGSMVKEICFDNARDYFNFQPG